VANKHIQFTRSEARSIRAFITQTYLPTFIRLCHLSCVINVSAQCILRYSLVNFTFVVVFTDLIDDYVNPAVGCNK